MSTLTLSPEELTLLRHALGTYLADLRMEVHATDSYDMREELKHEEVVLGGILDRLGPGPAEDPAAP